VTERHPIDRLTDRIVGPATVAPSDPVRWAAEALGVRYWSAQETIVRALQEHRHVAVKAAHAVGKSKVAAAVMAWWIAGTGRPLGQSFAISTAPTSTQLSAVVWRELGRCHRDGRLPGRITGGAVPTWTIDGEIVAMGRKPQDLTDVEAAASAFQGVHARYPLAVIDEAGGCPAWVFDAVEAVTTSDASRTLAIGNPTSPASRFAEICAPGSGWHVLTIPAMSTPAFTGERVDPALLDMLVSPRWVEERRERWGESSPLWKSRVLAQFPDASDDALIDPAHIEAAQARSLTPTGPINFGVDVARSGGDCSVVYRLQGGRLRRTHSRQGADLMETSGTVAKLLHEGGVDASAIVDTIGVGAGVYDRLAEQGANVVPFNASERATDPARFKNARAEAFWRLRELLREGALDLDPEDDELAGELVSLKWGVDSSGRIQIGSKSELTRSPDNADAAALAIGVGEIAVPVVFAAQEDPLKGLDHGVRPLGNSLTGDLLDRPM